MADLQQEHQREIEGLLENIRQLSRELRLQMLIIDNFIPQDYQVKNDGSLCWCSGILLPPERKALPSFLHSVKV